MQQGTTVTSSASSMIHVFDIVLYVIVGNDEASGTSNLHPLPEAFPLLPSYDECMSNQATPLSVPASSGSVPDDPHVQPSAPPLSVIAQPSAPSHPPPAYTERASGPTGPSSGASGTSSAKKKKKDKGTTKVKTSVYSIH